eukprot:TRINITY_DN959_c1_g1_i1.p1 TRINITY_DN959_c1_g1~~TRINITY_DN959_c1_g1_i1.p1  ORF type:complete len:350 (+),score=59.55 TRINITY_DN959_c1_g1_i1:80-1129(+)
MERVVLKVKRRKSENPIGEIAVCEPKNAKNANSHRFSLFGSVSRQENGQNSSESAEMTAKTPEMGEKTAEKRAFSAVFTPFEPKKAPKNAFIHAEISEMGGWSEFLAKNGQKTAENGPKTAENGEDASKMPENAPEKPENWSEMPEKRLKTGVFDERSARKRRNAAVFVDISLAKRAKTAENAENDEFVVDLYTFTPQTAENGSKMSQIGSKSPKSAQKSENSGENRQNSGENGSKSGENGSKSSESRLNLSENATPLVDFSEIPSVFVDFSPIFARNGVEFGESLPESPEMGADCGDFYDSNDENHYANEYPEGDESCEDEESNSNSGFAESESGGFGFSGLNIDDDY